MFGTKYYLLLYTMLFYDIVLQYTKLKCHFALFIVIFYCLFVTTETVYFLSWWYNNEELFVFSCIYFSCSSAFENSNFYLSPIFCTSTSVFPFTLTFFSKWWYLSERVILFCNNIQLGFRSVAFDYSIFPYVFFYMMKSICYFLTVWYVIEKKSFFLLTSSCRT